MVVIDMDGTLLNSNDEISSTNIAAIKQVLSKKIKVVIATGRILSAIKRYTNALGLDSLIISANGALVSDINGTNIIFERMMDSKAAIKCVEIAKHYNIYYHIYINNTLYTEKLAYTSSWYDKLNKELPLEEQIPIKVIKDGIAIVTNNNKILKFVMIDDNTDKLTKARNEISKIDSVSVTASLSNNFEVMANGVSKGLGVKILAEHYGIALDEVVAIGDSENDIAMFKEVGLSIAMGNAIDEVKRIADHIAPTNDEDGVAYALRNYLI